MAAAVTFDVDAKAFRAELEEFAELTATPFPKQALREVGDFLVLRMVSRTNRGKDYKGTAFTPYSKSYAKVRKRKGRNTRPVDLTWTGKMLNALDSTVLPDGTISVFFNVTERGQVAFYHNADLKDWPAPRKKIPMRRFVDLDPNGPDATKAKKVLAAAKARQLEG